MKGYGLIICYLLVVVFIALSLLTMCGCRSTSTIESNTELRSMTQLTDRIDSLLRSTASWQQNIYNRQSSLVDSIRQWEKNDSSHVVVVNEKGDTVKERVEVHHYIERDHNSESKESETIVHLQSQVDSLIHITNESKALTDSLLREHSKEVIKEKELTLWQRIKVDYGGAAIGILVLIVAFFIVMWRRRS